jgi:hypothetical protein
MPRYLVETAVVATPMVDTVMQLVAQRFPEISVEHRYTAHDDTDAREYWVCRAPSEAHLDRWTAAAELPVESVHRIGAEHLHQRQPG